MALLVWLAFAGIGRGLLRGVWFFKVARGRQKSAIALLHGTSRINVSAAVAGTIKAEVTGHLSRTITSEATPPSVHEAPDESVI